MEKTIGKQRDIIRIATVIGVIVSIIHFIAVINDWYRVISWVDMPVHFLWGGVAAFIIYFLAYRFPGYVNVDKNFFAGMIIALSGVALVGTFWEFGEFFYDLAVTNYGIGLGTVQFGLRDTLGDLFFNLFGALTIAIFIWLRYHKKELA